MTIMFIPVGPLALPNKGPKSSTKTELPCPAGVPMSSTVVDVEPDASTVATRINSVDRTSAVPSEVLLLIFSFLFGSTSAEDIRDQIYSASAVCKLWDALIKHTPQFWAMLPKLRSASGMTYNQTASLPYTYDEEEDPSQAPNGPIWSCACDSFEECRASTENDTGSSGEDVSSGEELGALREGEGEDQDDSGDSEDESESNKSEDDSEEDEHMGDSDKAEGVKHEHVQDSFPPQAKNSFLSSYLHIMLKYLVRSYPLPVEAHLCLPPKEALTCRDCGALEFLMYTVLQVLQRAKTLSLDVHISSVRLLQTILRCEPISETLYLPDVVRTMKDVENLTMPRPAEPEYKKQSDFPHLEDLSIILSHSAQPEADVPSADSSIKSLFKGVILKHFAIVNAIRVVPQIRLPWPGREPLILTTDMFHKGTWSSLTTFQGAFTSLGDIRVVLVAASNLREALFVVHIKDEQNIFSTGEMAAMDKSIQGMGFSNVENGFVMPHLRSLTIKISGDSFSPVAEPLRDENGDIQQPDGPGTDLFDFILKGVEFPALEAVTLSAAFLLFSAEEPRISYESSNDLEDFFRSPSLACLTLEKMPIGIRDKAPYINTATIPDLYRNIFEVLGYAHTLQELTVNEPITFDQFENITDALSGAVQVNLYGDGILRPIDLPEPLHKIKMALRYRDMDPYLLNKDCRLEDMVRSLALHESLDNQEQEWIGYSCLELFEDEVEYLGGH